ncbi:MAG: RHS repeat domain-containing protein [bacterium]
MGYCDREIGYRFGFNGKEKDDEWHGSTGTVYDYGFRIYDARIARFLSVDPLTKSYPWYTPYQFAGNNPIWAIDLDGLEEKVVTGEPQLKSSILEKITSNELNVEWEITNSILHQIGILVEDLIEYPVITNDEERAVIKQVVYDNVMVLVDVEEFQSGMKKEDKSYRLKDLDIIYKGISIKEYRKTRDIELSKEAAPRVYKIGKLVYDVIKDNPKKAIGKVTGPVGKLFNFTPIAKSSPSEAEEEQREVLRQEAVKKLDIVMKEIFNQNGNSEEALSKPPKN